MSSLWKKPWYSPKQQENNWLNGIWQSHDNFCSCENTYLHLIQLINKDSNCRKPVEDLKNILCLLIGKDEDTKDTEEKDDPGFLPGELEKLFDEGENSTRTEDVDTR